MTELTGEEERLLEAFISYVEDKLSEGGGGTERLAATETDARSLLTSGYAVPERDLFEDLGREANIDDVESVLAGLEEKGVVERTTETFYPVTSAGELEDQRDDLTEQRKVVRVREATLEQVFQAMD
ncbi:MAG: hypothetical protein SV186_04755 [Candidatus Nanohaloarchaea archaeon]|nr:hypothetical protein [Candidatus Nanohaloarchaea archaeon]